MFTINNSDIEALNLYQPNKDIFRNVSKYRSTNPVKRWVFEQYLRDMTEFTKGAKSIIDIGCGEGVMLYLADKFEKKNNLVGIDLSGESLDIARQIVNAKFYLADAHDLSAFKTAEFDLSMCLSLFEHIDGHEHIIEEMLRISKRAVITIPHPLLFRIICILTFRNWASLGREDNHIKEFTIEELKNILPNNANVERRGFWIVASF